METSVNRPIICCSFAARQSYAGSANMTKPNAQDIYLKNACVCCCSAKVHNPDCEVAFVHNLESLPEKINSFFEQFGVRDIYVPYDRFVFPADYKWSLAFYKLCVLRYLAYQTEYDAAVLLDTDTVFLGNIDSVWEICKQKLMLYNVQHSLKLEAMQQRMAEYRELYHSSVIPSVYGGEFVAGSASLLQEFVNECEKVYCDIVNSDFVTQFGDEFITFCAAESYKGKISDAAPYIRRYWTTNLYFQAFTDHALELRILHIPNEKENGIIRIYKYICKYGHLPEHKVMFQMLGLPRTKRPIYLRNLCYQLYRKCRKALMIISGYVKK